MIISAVLVSITMCYDNTNAICYVDISPLIYADEKLRSNFSLVFSFSFSCFTFFPSATCLNVLNYSCLCWLTADKYLAITRLFHTLDNSTVFASMGAQGLFEILYHSTVPQHPLSENI